MKITDAFVSDTTGPRRFTVGEANVKQIKVDSWGTGMHILEICYDDGSIEEFYNTPFSIITKP